MRTGLYLPPGTVIGLLRRSQEEEMERTEREREHIYSYKDFLCFSAVGALLDLLPESSLEL